MATPNGHDWYLREWFAALGLKQRDLITKLDYQPATANALWHSTQRYRRDHVEDVAALLQIKPYELLMHPDDAMKLRRLQSVIAEVAKPEAVDAPIAPPQATGRTGTDG